MLDVRKRDPQHLFKRPFLPKKITARCPLPTFIFIVKMSLTLPNPGRNKNKQTRDLHGTENVASAWMLPISLDATHNRKSQLDLVHWSIKMAKCCNVQVPVPINNPCLHQLGFQSPRGALLLQSFTGQANQISVATPPPKQPFVDFGRTL